MKFSVDRIEEGIAVLENIYSKEIIEVALTEGREPLNCLP